MTEEIKSYIEVKNSNFSDRTVQVPSSADEILKFKHLLDAGVIIEEEFVEKKKQLLNI